MARHLAARARARLVLVGRGDLDDRRKQELAAIEAEGGEVLYLRADATDPEAMRVVVAAAHQRFGPLNGVIHSAIVLEDKTIERMTEEAFRAALDPKVVGSAALWNAVANEPLDFFAFFSSAASFMGSIGQSNYLAGCGFEDALGHHLAARSAVPICIFNWSYWGSVGIVSSASQRQEAAARGMGSIEAREGAAAFEQVIASGLTQVVPIKAEPHLLRLMGVSPGSALELAPERVPSVLDALGCAMSRSICGASGSSTRSTPQTNWKF